jgi:hypothetical protein
MTEKERELQPDRDRIAREAARLYKSTCDVGDSAFASRLM